MHARTNMYVRTCVQVCTRMNVPMWMHVRTVHVYECVHVNARAYVSVHMYATHV